MNSNDPAVLYVLRRTMVARIVTLSRNGRPSINPLYFIYASGHIWLGTSEWTLAARNVKADLLVSVLFEVERDRGSHQVLRISGRARVRTGRQAQRSYTLRVARKYPPFAWRNPPRASPTCGSSSSSTPITPKVRSKAGPASSKSPLSKPSSSIEAGNKQVCTGGYQ